MRPPRPYCSRAARPADAEAIAAVFNDCDRAHSPEPIRIGEREVRHWQHGAVAFLVVADEYGEIVAYGGAVMRGEALSAENLVAPTATGRGIGAFLLDWSEGLARERRAETLRVSTLAGDDRARSLLATRGYAHIRSFYRMLIDLTEPPRAPRWPDGITVAPLREGEERLLHGVVEESFADHWGHISRSFEEWHGRLILEHDVTFLARDGGEVAGAVVCNEDLYGSAMVGTLGVRKPWRGRGLGRALLRQAFGALYARGKRRVGLALDAGNETGAVRLYESVGMRVAGREDVYERPAAGRDSSPAAQV